MGSTISFASSKFTKTDAIEPSGFVTPLSQVPLKGSGGIEVAVGGKDVGEAGAGVATGEAQADRTTSRSRVVMMRMSINIIQRIRKIPLQLGGSIEDPSGEGLNQIYFFCLGCGLCAIMHPQLAKYLFGIPAHGTDRQHEFARNLGIGVTLCHQLQNLDFLLTE